MVIACCLLVLSLVIEVVNNLPLLAASMAAGKLAEVPSGVLLRRRQEETIRYLSLDVAGFTLLYAAVLFYAVVCRGSGRLLPRTIVVSVALFVANVPCLCLSGRLALILMSLSIFALAPVPVCLAGMATERVADSLLGYTGGAGVRVTGGITQCRGAGSTARCGGAPCTSAWRVFGRGGRVSCEGTARAARSCR